MTYAGRTGTASLGLLHDTPGAKPVAPLEEQRRCMAVITMEAWVSVHRLEDADGDGALADVDIWVSML